MSSAGELDAADLLKRVAERVPSALQAHVVVIGSIATALAFRDLLGTQAVALNGVLAPHGTTLDAYRRAHASVMALIDQA